MPASVQSASAYPGEIFRVQDQAAQVALRLAFDLINVVRSNVEALTLVDPAKVATLESQLTSLQETVQQLLYSGFQDVQEIADPQAPPVNVARIYARDNGAGKTQLVVGFNTGAVQVLATQP